jgi:hypothetical protein
MNMRNLRGSSPNLPCRGGTSLRGGTGAGNRLNIAEPEPVNMTPRGNGDLAVGSDLWHDLGVDGVQHI